MEKIINGKRVFENANGNTYKVISVNGSVAIIDKGSYLFDKDRHYIFVKGYNPNENSWGNGNYDLTLEEAQKLLAEY